MWVQYLVFQYISNVICLFAICSHCINGQKRDTGELTWDKLWGYEEETSDLWNLNNIPEQIHLALGDQVSEMIVVWASPDPLQEGNVPSVVYGVDASKLDNRRNGTSLNFEVPAQFDDHGVLIDANLHSAHGYHRVVLTALMPNTRYWYKVISGNEESSLYLFNTLKEGHTWPARFIVYGDMGRKAGAISLGRLREEAERRENIVDAFIHVGDFAYDFHKNQGKRGDLFMQRIESIASRVPYMTCPGNHEIFGDFAHYRYRFSMPSSDWPIPLNKMWYSFNVGLVHFISYSTEVYFTHEGAYINDQLNWLEEDLKYANVPTNRTAQPWIIAFGHRPMYCSNADRDDCTKKLSIVRAGLETLMYKYGVDVIIQGHEHSYERLYPVYNETVTNCDYVNPKAPVHLISGAAGCNEESGLCFDVILHAARPWSAFRSWLPGLNGYGRLTVHNSTHLYWEQVIAYTGQVMDSLWMIQENHAPFSIPFVPDQSKCSV